MKQLSTFGVFALLLLISCNSSNNKSNNNSSLHTSNNSPSKKLELIKKEAKSSAHNLSLNELQLLLNNNVITQAEFTELAKLAQK